MVIKTRTKILIPAAILFCILYMVFAFRQMGTELAFTPEWTEDISHVKTIQKEDELIPFRLGQSLGYFTPEGKIVTSLSFPSKASISDCYYATFNENNSSTKVYNKKNEIVSILKYSGFPYFDEDRIFVMMPGGTSFIQCNERGDQLWRYEYFAPITAFASSKAGTVAGFADGTIISFSKDGNVEQQFAPGGSNIPVILGADISEDGSMIACICGQNKQRFVLARKDVDHSKIIFHEYFDKDQTKQLFVKFNKANDTVYFDAGNAVGILDINTLKSSRVEVPGSVIQIEESSVDGLVFVLSRKGRSNTVTVIEPVDNSLGHFSFDCDCSFINVKDDALFVGMDNKISRVTVSRK